MIDLKLHIRVALIYFILAAGFGSLLRSFSLVDFHFNYKFILHTHSHIALLGWVYLALTTLMYKLYLSHLSLEHSYKKIFWFTQFTLLGMLLTFPFMGYAVCSIIFSTLFLFASYWFAWFCLKHTPAGLKKTNSFKCVRAALWYLIISSIGPWALGAIMNTLGPTSIWYTLAIYFYLHFLYNGFMIMALIAMFLYVFEAQKIPLPLKSFKTFYRLFNLGILLSFFLSVLFTKTTILFNILGGFGAIFQVIAFGILLFAINDLRITLNSLFSKTQILLLKTVAILVALKMLLQVLSAQQYLADLVASFLDFVIGYLHLTFLGVVSIALYLFLDYFGLLRVKRSGYYLYIGGFIITEVLILYRAITSWLRLSIFAGYAHLLTAGSLLILLSLMLILWQGNRVKDA